VLVGVALAAVAAQFGRVFGLRVLSEVTEGVSADVSGKEALLGAGEGGRAAAHVAAVNERDEALVAIAELAGPKALVAQDSTGATPLLLAFRRGSGTCVSAILDDSAVFAAVLARAAASLGSLVLPPSCLSIP